MDRRSFLAAMFGAAAVGSTASLIGVSDVSAATPTIGASPDGEVAKDTLDEVHADFVKGGKRGNRGRHLGWGRGRRRGPPMYARRRRRSRRGYGRRFY